MITATGLSARFSKRAAIPAFRGQRQFSSSRLTLKEIQDAYIMSASRTPTAKVSLLEVIKLRTMNADMKSRV